MLKKYSVDAPTRPHTYTSTTSTRRADARRERNGEDRQRLSLMRHESPGLHLVIIGCSAELLLFIRPSPAPRLARAAALPTTGRSQLRQQEHPLHQKLESTAWRRHPPQCHRGHTKVLLRLGRPSGVFRINNPVKIAHEENVRSGTGAAAKVSFHMRRSQSLWQHRKTQIAS